MRARFGVIESLGLVGSLVFALPAGIAGVELLLDGRTAIGATLVVVALLMIVVPRRVTTPGDLPGDVAARIVDRTVLDPDEDGRTTDGERRQGTDGRDGEGGRDEEDEEGGEGREATAGTGREGRH